MHTRPTLRIPLTAAALSLLLAACGGGGDGDSTKPQAVSSSPSASGSTAVAGNGTAASPYDAGSAAAAIPGTITSGPRGAPDAALTNAIAENTPQPPVASNDSNQAHPSPLSTGNEAGTAAGTAQNTDVTPAPNTSGSRPNDASSTDTAPPAVVPLVSAQGVRGDVLLAMFDQQACRNEFDLDRSESLSAPRFLELTPQRTSDTPPVLAQAALNVHAYYYDMSQWQKEGRHAPARAPEFVYRCGADVRSYSNPMRPGGYTYRMLTGGRYHTYLTYRYYGNPSITKGVNGALVEYPLMVTQHQFIVGNQVRVELKEDFGYKATTLAGDDVPHELHIEPILSGTARTYERQGLVPFGAVNQWKDSAGNDVELLLVKTNEPDTVRICTHLNSTLAKRLHCVTWKVPANWSWGEELVGGQHYLIDDRSVYTGETGLLYWH